MNNILFYFFKYFIVSQLILLPVVISYIGLRRTYNNYKYQWSLHRVILILTLVIPIFLFLKPEVIPVKNVVAPVKVSSGVEELQYAEPQNNLEYAGVLVIPQTDSEALVPVVQILDLYLLLESIPLLVLCIGFFLVLKLFVFEYYKMYRLKKSISYSEKYKGIQVFTSSLISSPFSYGVIRPLIFLPENLDKSEKSIVITHELNHINGNHLLWLKIEVILKRIFWINPVYYILNYHGNELRELVCDEESIKEVNFKDYGRALINSAKNNLIIKNLNCTYWGGESLLKKRIDKLIGEKKMPKGINKLTPYVSLLFVFILSIAVPVASFSKDEIITDSVVVENSSYRDFLKLSNEKGALAGGYELNMKEVIESIPSDERNLFPLGFPVHGGEGRVTLPWGSNVDPFTGKNYFHTAFDIANKLGKKIVATGAGKVVDTGSNPKGHGNYIVLKHKDNFYSVYAQLQKIGVNKGQLVEKDDILGTLGSSGRSTGPHLHYSISHIPEEYKNIHSFFDRMVSLNPFYFLPDSFIEIYMPEDFKNIKKFDYNHFKDLLH